MTLNSEIEDFLLDKGALKVGFTTVKDLSGGPPSADLTYLLPEARSAVSFALPLNKEHILSFLSKKNWKNHVQDNIQVNTDSVFISNELIEMLKEKGFKADQPPPPGNYVRSVQEGKVTSKLNLDDIQYRHEVPNWRITLPPVLSHRYIAVRSGVGSFGWSGNVGMKDYGTTIILGSVVTSAQLEPTDLIPPEESFCDKCKICVASCVSEWMEKDKENVVNLGGKKFIHCARKIKLRCQLVCGGFSGLHKSERWSTWSPGRYKLHDDDNKMMSLLAKAYSNYLKWPKIKSPDHKIPGSVRLTCANCQLVCFGNRKETSENYRTLIKSGCVIQDETGDILVLPPDEAKEVFEKMDRKHRKLYSRLPKIKSTKSIA